MVFTWIDSLAKYGYSAYLSKFQYKEALTEGFTNPSFTAEINNKNLKEFENAFRKITNKDQFAKYSIIGEVCFWKLFTKSDPHNPTNKLLNHIKFKYNFQKFCLALRNLEKNPTLEYFKKFRLACNQPNGFAVPITFLSFYNPEKYPMADAVIAHWWNKNKDKYGYNKSPNFLPDGIISGFPDFVENNWKVYLIWSDFCQEYAQNLTRKSKIPWRARDVEMAIFFNHQKGITQLTRFEKPDDLIPYMPSETSQITGVINTNPIIDENKSRAHHLLVNGLKFEEVNQLNDAYKFFKQAINYDPENIFIRIHVAFCLQKMNRYSDAAKCYRKILEIDPINDDAILGLSICLQKISPKKK